MTGDEFEQGLTFDEFMHLPFTEERQLLIQAIAILTAQPRFENKTPKEVYDYVVTRVAEIKAMSERSGPVWVAPVQ